jgi:antitoxin component YwqK of YwqJK toxin-antitoxin module
MKRLLLIVLPLLLIVGCSKEPINYETTLIQRKGIFYTKDTNKPYSGQVFSLYHDGKKKGEGTLKDGEMISKTEWEWYENGQKKSENILQNGERVGVWTKWYENGQKIFEITMKDGEWISHKEWNEDGSVKE